MTAHDAADLRRIYERRFAAAAAYRQQVWRVLISDFFQSYVRATDVVLDLGCGYGEFINHIACGEKLAMDLNPDVVSRVSPSVRCLVQDCSQPWALADDSLDVVFTSNFFEHLPDKAALGRTLDEIRRCLRPGGLLMALGPNARYLPGAYWDFWDHYIPLTERSLVEALATRGFETPVAIPRFLPYTMADGRTYPVALLRLYLRMRWAWRLFGRQFLVVGRKETSSLPRS